MGSARFIWVLIAAALVVSGTGVILAFAVRTATSKPVDIDELEPDGIANKIAKLEGIEGGVPDLVRQFKEALNRRDEAIRQTHSDPTNLSAFNAARIADAAAKHLSQIVEKVIRMGSYEAVSKQWRAAMIYIALGALVSLVGLLIFIWAINPPEQVAASEASPAVVGEAAIRTLTLTPDGQSALAIRLGSSCDATQPLEVAYLDTTDTGPDVVVQQQGCKPLRLIVTERWGEIKEPPPS